MLEILTVVSPDRSERKHPGAEDPLDQPGCGVVPILRLHGQSLRGRSVSEFKAGAISYRSIEQRRGVAVGGRSQRAGVHAGRMPRVFGRMACGTGRRVCTRAAAEAEQGHIEYRTTHPTIL